MAASIPYYSVDDLEHLLRDGNRYEVLDGVLLVTPTPGAVHQVIVARIVTLLSNAVEAPSHAFLFVDGAVSFPPRTQLEPDILREEPQRVAHPSIWWDIAAPRLPPSPASRSP